MVERKKSKAVPKKKAKVIKKPALKLQMNLGNQHSKGKQNALGHQGKTVDYEKHAKALKEWAVKSDSIHLADFCISIGYASSTVYTWQEKSDDFKEAWETAKDLMNARLRALYFSAESGHTLRLQDVKAHDVVLKMDQRKDMEHKAEIALRLEKQKTATATEIVRMSQTGNLSQK